MNRLLILPTILLFAFVSLAAAAAGPPTAQALVSTTAPRELKDLYFGEALYYAFQGEWFDAIARLDTELEQLRRVDEPRRDSLFFHVGQAEFAVGDFELAYRMHQRAGRAIQAVIDGKVDDAVRNEAIYRLARINFKKDRPEEALRVLEQLRGPIPAGIADDLAFLRAQLYMAVGRFDEAAPILDELRKSKGLQGFASYDLGIALLRQGKKEEGRQYLDRTGQLVGETPAVRAIRDKANLVLGYKLLKEDRPEAAKTILDRVRLKGPFSNRALLGSGWADAAQGHFDQALVPWSLLVEREVTDPAVQEALLAVPFAYGKLNAYGRAAQLYGRALEGFGRELDKLDASIKSIREGNFLKALVRQELKQDADWVVKLRSLPQSPETYYLLDLMASNDFQAALKNYLDLEELRQKLATWEGDLDAYEELIAKRRAYYQPLLPEIDRAFRRLDSRMRLRLEQRILVEKRLQGLLTAPHPDSLASGPERLLRERLDRLEKNVAAAGAALPPATAARIRRLRGVLAWNIATDYDRRLTEAFADLRQLNRVVAQLQRQYTAFVRTRQAATQSYEGYDATIRSQRARIKVAKGKVGELMARQGHWLEVMAVNELTRRRERLEEFEVKARFALADSYDRAARSQGGKGEGP